MKCGFHLLKKIDCWLWIDWFWTYTTSYFQWRRSIQNSLKCFFDDSNDNKATTFQESFELIQSTTFLLNSMMLRSIAYPIVINFNGRSFSYIAKSSFWSCLLLTMLFQASCFIIIFIKLLAVENKSSKRNGIIGLSVWHFIKMFCNKLAM